MDQWLLEETIGTRLKSLRIERNLSMARVAEMVGISRQQVWNLENEKFEPTAETLKKFADAFKVSTDYLVGRSPIEVEDTGTQLKVNVPNPKLIDEAAEIVMDLMIHKGEVSEDNAHKLKQQIAESLCKSFERKE